MIQPERGFKPWQPAADTAIWLLYGNYQSVFSRVPHSGRPLQDGRGCVRPLSICGPAWCLFAFSLLVQAQKPTSQLL